MGVKYELFKCFTTTGKKESSVYQGKQTRSDELSVYFTWQLHKIITFMTCQAC